MEEQRLIQKCKNGKIINIISKKRKLKYDWKKCRQKKKCDLYNCTPILSNFKYIEFRMVVGKGAIFQCQKHKQSLQQLNQSKFTLTKTIRIISKYENGILKLELIYKGQKNYPWLFLHQSFRKDLHIITLYSKQQNHQ